MANAKKLSVFGGGSSSRGVPRAKRVSLGPPRAAQCACAKRESLVWIVTGTFLDAEGTIRFIGEWKCAACRQLPCPF